MSLQKHALCGCLWIYNPDWSLFKDTQKLYLSLIFHQVACILMLKLFWMQYWILSRIVNHLRLTLDLLISLKMPYCQHLAVMKIEEALVHQARVRWSTLKHCSCYGKKWKSNSFTSNQMITTELHSSLLLRFSSFFS